MFSPEPLSTAQIFKRFICEGRRHGSLRCRASANIYKGPVLPGRPRETKLTPLEEAQADALEVAAQEAEEAQAQETS